MKNAKRQKKSRRTLFRVTLFVVGLTLSGMALYSQGVLPAAAQPAGPALANAADDGERVDDRRFVCMLQDSVQAKAGLEHPYDGKTYYLCCAGCVAAFEKQPERYSRALDPVSGDRVDKANAPIYAYKGYAYFFASEANVSAFAKDPERYLRAR